MRGIISGDSTDTTECLVVKRTKTELEAFVHDLDDFMHGTVFGLVDDTLVDAAYSLQQEYTQRNSSTTTSKRLALIRKFWRYGLIKQWVRRILSYLNRCDFPLLETLAEELLERYKSLLIHMLDCERPLQAGFKRLRRKCVSCLDQYLTNTDFQ